MNKVRSPKKRVSSKKARPVASSARVVLRVLMVATFIVASTIFQPTSPRAQRTKDQGANVTGVKTSEQGEKKVVSITGDGAMNRVQTWQDEEGFHVVFPGGKAAPGRMSGGVRAQRVGDSLELIVPTRRGASVTVQPRGGQLDLVVSGGLDEGAAQDGPPANFQQVSPERGEAEGRREQNGSGRRRAGPEGSDAPRGDGPPAPEQNAESGASNPQNAAPPASKNPGGAPEQPLFNQDEAFKTPGDDSKSVDAGAAAAQAEAPAEEGGMLFSMTGLLMLSAVVALGGLLFIVRRRRVKDKTGEAEKDDSRKSVALVKAPEPKAMERFELPPFEPYKGDRRKKSVLVEQDRRHGTEEIGLRFNVTNGSLTYEVSNGKQERKPEVRQPSAPAPAVLFGAYQIDQEVGKLAQGMAHSIEVLASRATDDRRAIETSLIKALGASDTSEEGRRRVRQALEDYGFVARQSASLLLSSESYERVSAARILGQVRAKSALPFLLEALYDAEPVVRSEAVSSLGALGLPRAIGALIDTARRYPEIPSSLITPALTACSFEAHDLSWDTHAGVAGFMHDGAVGYVEGELAGNETTGELPEWLEDENLADALERLESADVEARVTAAQSLAHFPARRSVEALTAILVRDDNAAVRAAAVTSLGAIDHETVFAPVLFALADEAREVRAAAARAYSGANYDRADAVVRLIETADRETLEDLARASVKSGMAAQAVNRLSSEDRRQAYEAFSLLSLVVKGGQFAPIVEAVERHRDVSVRLTAVRVAVLLSDQELLESLRELSERIVLPREVREAVLEAVEQGAHK